jgi:hypothetical protein
MVDTFKQAPRPLREVIEGIRRMPSIKLEKEELEQLVSKIVEDSAGAEAAEEAGGGWRRG